MKKLDELPEFSSSRKRLSELRERKIKSVSDSIEYSRTTVLTNMVIAVSSGVFFVVGIVYLMRFIHMRKSFMEPTQYQLFMGLLILIVCGWFIILFLRIRKHYKLLRKASAQKHP